MAFAILVPASPSMGEDQGGGDALLSSVAPTGDRRRAVRIPVRGFLCLDGRRLLGETTNVSKNNITNREQGRYAFRRGLLLDIAEARTHVDPLWENNCLCGIVASHPKRPGRGKTQRSSNKKGWRYETRRAELNRFEETVRDVADGICAGRLTCEQARQLCAKAGYERFIWIADSKEKVAEAFVATMNQGDNVWVDCRTDAPSGGYVLLFRCWYDPSH
jgi:hypothetical protein